MNLPLIKGSTRIGGLIGRQIDYSLSPAIHNRSAAILGLDCVYLPVQLAEFPNRGFFDSLLNSNVYGFNVTVPYKEAAARAVQAPVHSVNTFYSHQGEWRGTSTDGAGFAAGLLEIEVALEECEAVILLGFGGAAQGLADYMEALGFRGSLIAMSRRGSVPGYAHVRFEAFHPDVLRALIKEYPRALLVQCTNAPQKGDDLRAFSLKGLQGPFVDIIYGANTSALLQEARTLGLKCQDGLPMLIHQALLSQKLWWGDAAPYAEINRYLQRSS